MRNKSGLCRSVRWCCSPPRRLTPRSRRHSPSASGSTKAVSGSISFDGVWTGSEAASFGKVIKAFNKVYPKVKVKYKPLGNNVSTVLATAIAGGHPPDMADIAQPGYIRQLVAQGKLKPITYANSVIAKNFAPSWRQLGTFNGKSYALVFKAANKSLVWYNVPAFKNAGVTAPKTWAQLLTDGRDVESVRHAGLFDRRLGRVDAHRHVREHLLAHVRTGEVRRPDGPQDQVDRLVREEGADARWARCSVTLGNITGGTSGSAPVRVQRLGHERVRIALEGRNGLRSRLRLGSDRLVDEVKAVQRLQRVPVPVDRKRRTVDSCRGRGRSVRHVPRQPRDPGVRQVPRHAPGCRGVGEAGRLRDGEPQRPGERLSKRDRPFDCHGRRTCEVRGVRHVR